MSAPIPVAGQWVVFRSYGTPGVRQCAKVTPTLVKLDGGTWPRQKPRTDIIACLDTKDAALLLAQSLAGAGGQRDNRIKKARADYEDRKAAAWVEYERTEDRLVASAMSAGTAETQSGSGLQPASAAPKADAQNLSPRRLG